MLNFDKNALLKDLHNLSDKKVLVVGDLAIDEMIYGDTERISREAPVLILLHNRTNIILGGGSNAAHNLSALNGGKVSVVGVVGNDYHAPILAEAFRKANINTEYLVVDQSRHTTVKTRISGSCSQSVTQQIVRIDRQTTSPISKEVEDRVLKQLEIAVPLHDAVILSNYHLGFLTQRVVDKVIELSKKYGKKVVVDAQKNLGEYQGVTALTPNQPDTEKFVGYKITDTETLIKAGKDVLEKTNAEMVLVTRGDRGIFLFEKNEKITHIPAFNKTDVFDVTGAGDTVVAAFTLALAAGLEPAYAAIIGNIAASIVIRHFGCATTTLDEISSALESMNMEKLLIKN